jgi:spermidine synthase
MAKTESVEARPRTSVFRPALSGIGAHAEVGALLTSIFIIAVCGLIYELIIGSLSSYLLGNSVQQFSFTLGFFLAAMGIGSFLSRAIKGDLLRTFLIIEIVIGLVGGASAAFLFAAYSVFPRSYMVVMIAMLVLLGTLIGLEIPLLARIARRYGNLRDTLANVLAVDYLGALGAALLFPLVLLPYLGLSKTSFLVGMFNLGVVGINLRVFGRDLPKPRGIIIGTLVSLGLLGAGFLQSAALSAMIEEQLYQDPVLYAEQSAYQRIVITSYQDDVRLYLDRELQFSSRDEYRYHESLVHPAMSLAPSREQVLIIGGGDGLAMREVLKYKDVQRVTLVDLDPVVTRLGKTFGPIVALNGDSLNDPRANVVTADGFQFLADTSERYGVIIADLPDARNESLAKLYSREFYRMAKRHLVRGGIFVQQSSSPYFVREAYWCIAHTMAAADLSVQTYHTYIPSFGDWGFVMASDLKIDWSRVKLQVPTRYLTNGHLPNMAVFDPDTSEVPTDISTLENPLVMRYYMEGWRRWRG